MRKTKLIPILAGLFSLAVIGTCSGVMLSSRASFSQKASDVFDEYVKDVYKFNESFTIPNYEVEGATKTSASLIFPDGTAKKGPKVTLNQAGHYILRYTYTKDNKVDYIQKGFDVKYGLYYFSSDGEVKSSASYSTVTKYGEGQNFTSIGTNGSATYQTGNTEYYPNTGLLVNLAKNEKLTFTEPVPLSEFNGKEFIQFYAVPSTQGSYDLKYIYVQLTDANNPNLTVTFRVNKLFWTINTADGMSGVNVCGNGQIFTGLEVTSSGAKKWHRNDIWGTLIDHSFTSVINAAASGHASWSGPQVNVPSSFAQVYLGYDNDSKICYTGPTAAGRGQVFGKKDLTFVADLDDVESFDDLWKGFESDSVYVSMYGGEFTGNSAQIMIPHYRFIDDLSQEYLEDVDAPKLTVNTKYAPDNMPQAYVGKSYPVPSATAYDTLSGKITVKTKVDYNYLTGHPTDVKIVDNRFNVDREGVYRIIYTATDSYANKTEAIYYVHAGGDIEPLQVKVNNPQTYAPLGSEYKATTPLISGGSGEKTTKILLRNGDKTYDISESKSMYIKDVGDWKCDYVVSDFAGDTVTKSIDILVGATEESFIYDDIQMDPYLFNNVPTTIPYIGSHSYITGSDVETPAKVKVEYAGTSDVLNAGEIFTPHVNNNKDTIKFTYFSGETIFDVIERPVIDIGDESGLKIQNYFFGAEDNIEADSSGLKFLNNKGNDVVSWTFANKFIVNNTSLNIGNIYKKGKRSSDLGAFEFKVSDANNTKQAVTAYITVGSNDLTFKVSDKTYKVDFTFNASSSTNFTIEYKDSAILFKGKGLATTAKMEIASYDNGNPFNGFASNTVSLSLTARDIQVDNGYYLTEIGGCPVSSYSTDDTIQPYTYSSKLITGTYSRNSLYTIYPCNGADVLAPQTTCTVSVIAPDDTYVKDINGVELKDVDANNQYTFKLEQIGIYQISIECEETNWHWSNKSRSVSTITSTDDVPPVITLLEEVPTEVKIGTVVYMPKFRVSDDVTSAKDMVVYATLISPNGREHALDVNGGFKASLIGTYYVIITAKDGCGNLTSVTFQVECVE